MVAENPANKYDLNTCNLGNLLFSLVVCNDFVWVVIKPIRTRSGE